MTTDDKADHANCCPRTGMESETWQPSNSRGAKNRARLLNVYDRQRPLTASHCFEVFQRRRPKNKAFYMQVKTVDVGVFKRLLNLTYFTASS